MALVDTGCQAQRLDSAPPSAAAWTVPRGGRTPLAWSPEECPAGLTSQVRARAQENKKPKRC